MDGASILSGETARRKIYTVSATGMLNARVRVDPEVGDARGAQAFPEGLIAFAGGVPMQLDGQLIGAVAVSGGTSAQDQEIAEKATNALTTSTGS